MTPDIWNILVKAVEGSQECPSWLKDQTRLGWEVVSRLPVVDAIGNGQHAIPVVEEKVVTQNYLEFLREQIQLNARGPEWSSLIKNRLNALESFVGRKLLVATFYFKPHTATLRIHPETKEVIYTEFN